MKKRKRKAPTSNPNFCQQSYCISGLCLLESEPLIFSCQVQALWILPVLKGRCGLSFPPQGCAVLLFILGDWKLFQGVVSPPFTPSLDVSVGFDFVLLWLRPGSGMTESRGTLISECPAPKCHFAFAKGCRHALSLLMPVCPFPCKALGAAFIKPAANLGCRSSF